MIVFSTLFGKQGEITMPIKTKLLLSYQNQSKHREKCTKYHN